jgi:hypothetical protein
MKVPIDEYACIDLDAPVLPSYEAFVSGSVYWLVWCNQAHAAAGRRWCREL